MRLFEPDYVSPIPERCAGATGPPTTRASPATTLLDFVNNELFPTLKELALGPAATRAAPSCTRSLPTPTTI